MIDYEEALRKACVGVSGGKALAGWWPRSTIRRFHDEMSEEDACFIALAAPVTVRQMFDKIDSLRAERDRLRKLLTVAEDCLASIPSPTSASGGAA